ncbi:MAG: hypothetical protein JKY65_22575 [Planctomycetes bacterium]|nr:hypothetical protein [Planctomycetota bacterium]
MKASELTAGDLMKIAARSGMSLLFLVGAVVFTLLATVVLAITFQDVLLQDAMQEGVDSFYRRDPAASRQLRNLRSEGHDSASVFLAAYEYENARGEKDKLTTAVSLFEEALKQQPGRTSAVVGLVAAKLKLAEAEGLGPLKEAAKEAGSLLEGALNPKSPDVVYLQAAVDILLGNAKEAVEVLDEDPSEAPSSEGQGARWWNLAVAKLLVSEDPLPAAARAYNLRRWPLPTADQRKEDSNAGLSERADPERLLNISYRFALCDPACTPTDAEELEKRVEFGRRILDQRFAGRRDGGRYSPPRTRAAEIYNALGVGLCRVERYQDAAIAFEQAVRGQSKDPLYSMNLGVACTLALPTLSTAPAQQLKNTKDTACRAYENVALTVRNDKKHLSTLKLAVDNLLTIDYANDPGKGLAVLRKYRQVYPSKVDWNRNIGALFDWANKPICIRHYEKALELGHPDAVGIQERLGLWNKGKKK